MRTGRRILIVDDNIDGARLTAEALESVGHDTRVAFDGPGALGIAAAFSPDVALLDLGLPLMDGYELAQQLVAAAPDKEPLLVAVTGYGQASDHERTRGAGFHTHVVKPVDFGHLADLIDRLCAQGPTICTRASGPTSADAVADSVTVNVCRPDDSFCQTITSPVRLDWHKLN